MDVEELYQLSRWFEMNCVSVISQYNTLQAKLHHNANQQNKQPLKEDLNKLLTILRDMPVHELTNGQLALLEKENVYQLIGIEGANKVESIVKSARFDPASARSDILAMQNSLQEASQRMETIRTGLSSISYFEADDSHSATMKIRIHFKNEASISDVTEWKSWSSEWWDIIRGIAVCLDEPPESVKVLGANRGSVIMVLTATVAITGLLVLISKNLSKIVLNTVEATSAIQDLKLKMTVNKAIIDSLEDSKEKFAEKALDKLLETAVQSLPNPINGEQKTALKKSINKYHKFTEKGGELDFISPPDADWENDIEEEINELEKQQIAAIRENVEQLRDARQRVRLLTQDNQEQMDFEDEDLDEE